MRKQQVYRCLWHPESGSSRPTWSDPLEMDAENRNWVLQTSRNHYNCWTIPPVLNLDSLTRHCWEHFPIMICIYNFFFLKKKKLMSNFLKNVCASSSWIKDSWSNIILIDLIRAFILTFSELFLLLTSWKFHGCKGRPRSTFTPSCLSFFTFYCFLPNESPPVSLSSPSFFFPFPFPFLLLLLLLFGSSSGYNYTCCVFVTFIVMTIILLFTCYWYQLSKHPNFYFFWL